MLCGIKRGGIAQVARALGSYPGCRWFESNCRYHGPLVKRLRHRPFTAESWVQFPYGSPNYMLGNSVNTPVSEFFFYTENRVCPLLVRYSDFVADILVLSCCILRKKTERSVHRLSHSRLCGLEHMSIDVQSRSRIAMP